MNGLQISRLIILQLEKVAAKLFLASQPGVRDWFALKEYMIMYFKKILWQNRWIRF